MGERSGRTVIGSKLRRARLIALALGWAPAGLAMAETASEPAPLLRGVEIVAATPLPGAGVDPDKLPAVVASLSSDDFVRTRSLAVTDALEQRIAGLSLSDTQGNAFTKDVNFRGFQASPLQGTPQGLAVYMNGVRLNEAFGDTVNWDLIPEVAIARADLFTSNPVFGLNALGGAVSLHTKTGFDSPGGQASVQGGSFGGVYGSAAYGAVRGPWAVYVAADGGRDDGWRLQSPSKVARAYADIGWKGERSEVHLFAAGEVNDFGVVGPTPVDLLNADRRAVYTYPQTTANHAGLVALNDVFKASETWSIQANLYLRRFNQHHVDGNDGDLEGCDDPMSGLCVESDGFPDAVRPPAAAFQVLGLDNQPIACPSSGCDGVPYGTVDRTRINTLTWGGSVQATSSGRVLGRSNVFAVGASLEHSRVRFSADAPWG